MPRLAHRSTLPTPILRLTCNPKSARHRRFRRHANSRFDPSLNLRATLASNSEFARKVATTCSPLLGVPIEGGDQLDPPTRSST
jgi:hypothetical protein